MREDAARRRAPLLRLGLAVAVLASMHAWAASAQAMTAQDRQALRRGEVFARIVADDGPGGRVQAAIDIAAPVSRVWAVMLDCARAPAFVPKLEACRVIEAEPDGSSDLREHRVRFIPLLPRLTLRFRSTYVDQQEIRFMREGGDLAVMEGVWRFEPLDGGRATRLHYDVRLQPRTPLPRGMVRSALARDTPAVLIAVREEAQRGL